MPIQSRRTPPEVWRALYGWIVAGAPAYDPVARGTSSGPHTFDRQRVACDRVVSMRYLELYRHTDNDGDELTPTGVAAAEELGRTQLTPPYGAFVSTGAVRATQMAEILRAAARSDDVPITERPALRSAVEERWRAAGKAAGKGADLEAIRTVDPDLVEKESLLLAAALKHVIDGLPDGARALVVGHSPTNEAAVLGLTRQVVPPMAKGDRVMITEQDGDYRVLP